MRPPISLEFFPPKTPQGADKLRGVRQQLYALKPEFCSVTFGAGGSTQEGTLTTVREIMDEGMAAAPHLSCIGQTRDSIRERLAAYTEAGVRRIVALRGDMPSGYGMGGEFLHASDLVAFIRTETGERFRIEVAAYPETHPQARSPQDDLLAFKAKVDAGADAGITQYFFNADAYFRYLDEVRALGIGVPVVPGIMPITNSSQLLRFSDACGAEVPRWIRMRLMAFGDDAAGIKAFGADVVAALCERLLAGGAPGLHIYTMNQAAAAQALCERLR
ncbi:methylenetetrahydrofolate reductase [NAD(P)H] [Ottowia sp.]|uniref:methylenetetrahydrofolate reductase [NAD(P)H] n=1 Tax=Ottowia sp. TaxID=1898956 RepID=UPI002C6CD9BA|nr:methylenetetrahydrofolate reductase [NAD(P)H] [Ottowia sp.]MCP5259253.1 methylenetetrahydrofolate reductase [NAD(P)H] [Burkholderiaceae bacterium]HPR44598.1 methylenetetrahydrofolate reductase [NAD(P)H] [Ottowia sp.]HRW71123.1 methylenetetrahydrofolate reductase [NAD(P)H] [Ottowia sp.]